MLIKPRKMIPLTFDREEHERERSSRHWVSGNGRPSPIESLNPVHLRNVERIIREGRHESVTTSDPIYQTIVNELEYKIKVMNDLS